MEKQIDLTEEVNEKIESCPFCGANKSRITCESKFNPPLYFVYCGGGSIGSPCGACGPLAKSEKEAIQKYNIRMLMIK